MKNKPATPLDFIGPCLWLSAQATDELAKLFQEFVWIREPVTRSQPPTIMSLRSSPCKKMKIFLLTQIILQ